MKRIRNGVAKTMMIGLAVFAAAALLVPSQAAASQTQPSAPAAAPAPSSPPASVFDPSKSDEKAIAIADKVIAAMGGAAWDKTRFIKFTFLVKRGETKAGMRTHYWDRFEQRSRMEGQSKEQKPVVAVVDHKTRQGQAMMDGQLLFDADAKKFIDLAYGNLINDSYWLFMPFKMKDPGVRLRYEGEVKAGPVTYDKILLTFDEGVGLTSKDRYWVYVNRADHKIERWSYVLEGQGANTSPIAWQWVDWSTIGGMNLSLRKTQPEGEVEILLEGVEVFDSLPDAVFTGTAPVETAQAGQPAGQ